VCSAAAALPPPPTGPIDFQCSNPTIFYNSAGQLAYDASTDTLSIDASPLWILTDTAMVIVAEPRMLSVQLTITESGALGGGVPGDDLTVEGAVDVDTDGDTVPEHYEGVLLTGEITEYGFQNDGLTDKFNFLFNTTGGELADLYGPQIGLQVVSEHSTFDGSFAVHFEGGAKGNLCKPNSPLAIIRDFVWHDMLHSQSHPVDGIQDPGEPGIEGVVLNLYDSLGALIATTTTNDVGYYEFPGVPPGTYTVEVAALNFAPGGVLESWNASPADRGGDDALDSDGDEVTHAATVTVDAGDNDATIDFGFFPTPAVCGPCKGGITSLTLQYNGTHSALVQIVQKKRDAVIFDAVLVPGEQFSFAGADKHGKMGAEIKVYIDGALNASVHTSCSQPIGPGLAIGDFEVIAGTSKDGGPLCIVDLPPEPDCGPCKGGITSLTLQYNGGDPAPVQIALKKKHAAALFDGIVAPGEEFSFTGTDKHGKMGAEIKVCVDGALNATIHTSCSRPIWPGLVIGDFEVIAGSSKKGGPLCEDASTP